MVIRSVSERWTELLDEKEKEAAEARKAMVNVPVEKPPLRLNLETNLDKFGDNVDW